MKWQIPAKTFLLGEYAALAEGSAIILTTTPYFELSLTDEDESSLIHPQSPAGKWWAQNQHSEIFLKWYDPYNGRGGLGASSAQFLACYWATCHLDHKKFDVHSMLEAYYQTSWTGEGLRPSGYDVIAQTKIGCVYINKQKNSVESYPWVFEDLSFLIIHTGVKLATHHHLMKTTLPTNISYLSSLVDKAKLAFEQLNSTQLINAINEYHQILCSLNLVAEHSLELINSIKANPEVVAIKGCGALGADTILILTKRTDILSLRKKLEDQKWIILASENNLTSQQN